MQRGGGLGTKTSGTLELTAYHCGLIHAHLYQVYIHIWGQDPLYLK